MDNKIKVSIYLPVEVKEELDRLYSFFMLNGEKQTFSSIVSNAIITYAKLAQAVQERDKKVSGQIEQ